MLVDPTIVKFTVAGDPVPQGNMRSFVVGAKSGKPRAMTVAKDPGGLERWRGDIRSAAKAVLEEGYRPFEGPVIVRVEFRFRRPVSHYLPANLSRVERVLRLDAPHWVTTDPDTDKLVRAVGDALTNVVWVDDKYIVKWVAQKVYSDPPGAYIEVIRA